MVKKILTNLSVLVIIAAILSITTYFFSTLLFQSDSVISESLIGGFSGAFFAFLFLRITEISALVHRRGKKHHTALVKMQTLFNKNVNVYEKNTMVIDQYRKVLRDAKQQKIVIIQMYKFEKFESPEKFIYEVLGVDLINNIYKYDLRIRNSNSDFETLNKWYLDFSSRSLDHQDIKTYIANLEALVDHLVHVETYLKDTLEKNISMAATVRVLSKSHMPAINHFVFQFLPTKVSSKDEKKILIEVDKIREELGYLLV